jgi:hypothetical protein
MALVSARRSGTRCGGGTQGGSPRELNARAVARQHLGSLDNVTRIVRLGGASELFESIFGKEKMSVSDNE